MPHNMHALKNMAPSNIPKTKLLVTFIQTHVGGAMTSLVNFLNALDLEKYEVDVLFYEIRGEGRFGIKEGIHILPQAKQHTALSLKNIASKLFYPPYVLARIREQYYSRVCKNEKKALQIISKQGCRYSKRLSKEYDVCVSYEFCWCMYYTANYVKARHKIQWHHLDYAAAGLDFRQDKKAFQAFDRFVFVSDEIMKKFTIAHPEYTEKSLYIPNLLSAEFVRQKGEAPVSPVFPDVKDTLKMITVARIDFKHKGHDRGVRILKRLKDEGLLSRLRWIIVGKGDDLPRLKEMIKTNTLTPYVTCLGLKENPIPYMKECDLLFLPSRFEGKPMVVTEGLMMGLVPLVSRYASAEEQLKNGTYGFLTENNEEALYEQLKRIVTSPHILFPLKETIAKTDFGNTKEIQQFDQLIDSL